MKWTVENMKRTTSEGMVVEVAYRVIAKSGALIAEHRGKVSLDGDSSGPDFIPFEQLTETQVLDWVKSNVDVAEIEAHAQAALNKKLVAVSAKETVTGLPWKNRIQPLNA